MDRNHEFIEIVRCGCGKYTYSNFCAAQKALSKIEKNRKRKRKEGQRVYRCPLGGYHLTSAKEAMKERKKTQDREERKRTRTKKNWWLLYD